MVARRSDGDPATRSMSSGANRTTRSRSASAAARRATPLTRIRLRAPFAAATEPGRTRATSIWSSPERPSTRATSAPHRISSESVVVRCETPRARTTIASSRLVLPAAFGPQTSCGPGPTASSRVAYARRSVRSSESRVARPTPAGAPMPGRLIGARLRGRADRHHHMHVAIVADRLEDARSEGPLELERELLRVHLLEHVREVLRVERDRGPVALHRGLDLADVVAHLGVGAHRDAGFAVRGDQQLHDVRGLVGDER